jgi:hypothetical protein
VGGSPDAMGTNIAMFAVGAIAEMDQSTTPWFSGAKNVTAQQPYNGSTLSVVWHYVWAVAATVISAHLVVFFIVAIMADLVIIQDDSNLSMANLLKPLVEPVDGRGYVKGEQIADAFERSNADQFMIYKDGVLKSQEQSRDR